MFRVLVLLVALTLWIVTAQAQTLVAPPRPGQNPSPPPAETPPPAQAPSPPPAEAPSPAQTPAPAPAPKHKAPAKKEKKPEATRDKPGLTEEAVRTCIHNRLKELVAQDQREDIAADALLRACSDRLRNEMKEKKKSYCEAVSYIGWLVADENNKLNGVQGQPYQPNKAFIEDCSKTGSWEKQR
jgi:hypothetical protein